MGAQQKAASRHFPYQTLRAMRADKRKASASVNHAVRAGRLAKLPCAACGTDKNVEAHHEDYSRPLDVVWLCRTHHRQHHSDPISGATETSGAEPVIWHKPHGVYLKNAGVSAPLVASVTARIAFLMKRGAITQNQLASVIGCSRQSLSQSLGGGVRSLRAMAVLADALGYEVAVTFRKRKGR